VILCNQNRFNHLSSPNSLLPCESLKRLLRSLLPGIRILFTGLSPDELAHLRSVTSHLSFDLAPEDGSNATHVVTKPSCNHNHDDDCNENADDGGNLSNSACCTCRTRTVKVFHGISSAAWVVSQQWLLDCCALGRPVCEEPYELGIATPAALAGCDLKHEPPPYGCLRGPTASRLRFHTNTKPLFHEMRILLIGDFHAPRVGRKELARFIENCGGTVLDRDGLGWRSVRGQLPPPRRNSESTWLVASYTVTPAEINQVANNWKRRPLTVSWILDSLSAYELCPPELYRIPDHGCEAELSEDKDDGLAADASQERGAQWSEIEHGEAVAEDKCRCRRCTCRR
jgi:hypothetical protein